MKRMMMILFLILALACLPVLAETSPTRMTIYEGSKTMASSQTATVSMNGYELFVYDVMVNHYQAWKTLADQLSIPFDRERNNLLRGISRMEILSIILEKSERTYSEQEKQAFAEQKSTLYRTLLHQMSPADVSDEAKDTLTFL